MIDRLMSGTNLSLLQRGLDVATLRQDVITNNITNISTPGFKKSQVAFEEELRQALNRDGQIAGVRTNAKHIAIGTLPPAEVSPQVHVQNDTSLRNDGNNVDIDAEMALLAKNNITYNAIISQVAMDFSRLKTAIKGQ